MLRFIALRFKATRFKFWLQVTLKTPGPIEKSKQCRIYEPFGGVACEHLIKFPIGENLAYVQFLYKSMGFGNSHEAKAEDGYGVPPELLTKQVEKRGKLRAWNCELWRNYNGDVAQLVSGGFIQELAQQPCIDVAIALRGKLTKEELKGPRCLHFRGWHLNEAKRLHGLISALFTSSESDCSIGRPLQGSGSAEPSGDTEGVHRRTSALAPPQERIFRRP
jgi:hypothetical protein